MAHPHCGYRATYRAAKKSALLTLMATFVSGCYFDISSTSSSGNRSAEEIAGLMVVQFAQQTNGVKADIECPTGLSGQAGSQFTCNETTSDGYTLKIVVSEREAGAFSWNIVESVPVS